MTNSEEGVLIADSHRLARGGMMSLVSSELGMKDVFGVDDFEGVVEVLGQRPGIRLLMLDMGLPGMGEMRGLREIRVQRPDLRVVALCWHQKRAEAFEALAAGAHGYLAKDLPTNEILDALRTVMSGQIYVPAMISEFSASEKDLAVAWENHEHAELTVRQREVLTHLAAGLSNKEIARALNIAEGTVKVHITGAFRALHVHNRVGAAAALLKREASAQGSQQELPGISVGRPADPPKGWRGGKFALACLPLAVNEFLCAAQPGLAALGV